MDFKTVPDLRNVKGIFSGLYSMMNDFGGQTPESYARKLPSPGIAVFVVSNGCLYIPKMDNRGCLIVDDVKPVPKPQPEKKARKWV